MSDDTEARLTIINRLLASFPATQSGQGDDVIDGYLIGISEVPVQFLAIAAKRFLAGQVPGQHTAFPPSPAQLATVAREHWYMELDEQRRRRESAEALKRLDAPAEKSATPEERARVKAKVDAFIAGVAEQHRTEDAEAARRKSERWQRTNARFSPDMDEEALAARLGLDKPRWTAGDPDGEEYAA